MRHVHVTAFYNKCVLFSLAGTVAANHTGPPRYVPGIRLNAYRCKSGRTLEAGLTRALIASAMQI